MNIKISIPRDRRQIPIVGKTVRHWCVLAGVGSHPSVKNIELAIVELLTNIIDHSLKGRESDIEVHCRFSGREFVVAVSDEGHALSSQQALAYTDNSISMPTIDTGAELDLLPEGGWGIQLIKSACDQITYKRENQRNVYELIFDLSAVAL